MGFTRFRGGYRLIPDVFEFWQGQTNRIHDRLVFRKTPAAAADDSADVTSPESWTIERLSP